MNTTIQTVKILRMPAVVRKLGIARATIYDWVCNLSAGWNLNLING